MRRVRQSLLHEGWQTDMGTLLDLQRQGSDKAMTSLRTTLLIALGTITMIGGTIFAGYTYVKGKDNRITELNGKIAELKRNQTKLTVSNESLMKQIERLNMEAESNRKQQDETLKLIRSGEKQISDMERYLNSPERMNDAKQTGTTDKALTASQKRQICLADLTLTNAELEECMKR